MTLAEIQAESGPPWLEIQSALTAAHDAGKSESQSNLASALAAQKAESDAALATANAQITTLQTSATDAAYALATRTAERDALQTQHDALVTLQTSIAASARTHFIVLQAAIVAIGADRSNANFTALETALAGLATDLVAATKTLQQKEKEDAQAEAARLKAAADAARAKADALA